MINSIKLTHSPIKSDYKEISNYSTMITVEKESKQEEKLYEKTSQVIWGIVLIGIGMVWALNALGLTDIDLFF